MGSSDLGHFEQNEQVEQLAGASKQNKQRTTHKVAKQSSEQKTLGSCDALRLSIQTNENVVS